MPGIDDVIDNGNVRSFLSSSVTCHAVVAIGVHLCVLSLTISCIFHLYTIFSLAAVFIYFPCDLPV